MANNALAVSPGLRTIYVSGYNVRALRHGADRVQPLLQKPFSMAGPAKQARLIRQHRRAGAQIGVLGSNLLLTRFRSLSGTKDKALILWRSHTTTPEKIETSHGRGIYRMKASLMRFTSNEAAPSFICESLIEKLHSRENCDEKKRSQKQWECAWLRFAIGQ